MADMSAASHSRHVCCVTQQPCLQCDTADMSAVSHNRHTCCTKTDSENMAHRYFGSEKPSCTGVRKVTTRIAAAKRAWRRCFLILRCQLFLSWRRRNPKVSDCSPASNRTPSENKVRSVILAGGLLPLLYAQTNDKLPYIYRCTCTYRYS